MIRKRAVKDTVNPPGQIVYDPVQHNMEQWKKWEGQRNNKSQLKREQILTCNAEICSYPECGCPK